MNGILEIIINKNDAEIILLKENIRSQKCSFGIKLIKEGLLLENVDNDEMLHTLRLLEAVQTKKVLGDTISANRINKSRGVSLPAVNDVEPAKKKKCQIF